MLKEDITGWDGMSGLWDSESLQINNLPTSPCILVLVSSTNAMIPPLSLLPTSLRLSKSSYLPPLSLVSAALCRPQVL